jgi:asparagine synthase (glutamine-hydrolysing)
VRGRLSPKRIAARGIFKPEFVSMTLDQHEAETHNWVALIWCMLSFDSWCDQTGLYGGRLAV